MSGSFTENSFKLLELCLAVFSIEKNDVVGKKLDEWIIKKKYWKLALETHSDKHLGSEVESKKVDKEFKRLGLRMVCLQEL
ncbi:MAG: hypothetical protein PV340_01995 [Wolbachia sp.]|nr:hypothetical protein [Wolbachia sp.]MDD9336478.1 hypothetical protein [Wolbachia sp.]